MRDTQGGRAPRQSWPLGRAAASICWLLLLFPAPAALAQSNDVYFRSWAWQDDDSGARASAVAGATVALADDATGLAANPAVLATISRSELALSVASSRHAHSVVGDALAARSSIDELAAALKLGARWGVAVVRREPQARRIELAALAASDGTYDEGSLSATSTDVGLALARSFGSRLALGVAVTSCRLSFSARYSRTTPPLPATVQVGAAGGADRITPSVGTLLSLSRHVRLGLSHRFGTRWQVTRVAVSPLLSLTLDNGTPLRVVRPSASSLGMHVSLSRRLALTAQIDYVASASAAPGVIEGYRALSVRRETWEPRLAAELALPARSISLVLRSGIHWIPRATRTETLTPSSQSSAGLATWRPPPPAALFERDAEQAMAHRLDARRVFGAGLAIVTRPGLRLDLAVRTGGEQTVFLAGTSWRF